MSGVLHDAAQALRVAAAGVEKYGSDTTAYGRAATDLDRLGFFRTDVARAIAEWLDYAETNASPKGQHHLIHACNLANLILKRADS